MGIQNGPKSWAEDVSTYRSTRGSQSYRVLQETKAPERFSRTNYVPFSDTRHSLYSYNDFCDGQEKIHIDPEIQKQRCRRHGWGDTSLLKHGPEGSARGLASTQEAGRRSTCPPTSKDGRRGLFGVLQMTEQGGADSWIGNHLVDPAKGKQCTDGIVDSKGRKDLFDVIGTLNPGVPADDSWLGHALVDPAKGKRAAPGPEQRRGRKGLKDVFGQSILNDPDRLKKLSKGADELGDSWLGNHLLDPTKGRLNPKEDASTSIMRGATFRETLPGWSDQSRRHARFIPPPVPTCIQPIIQQLESGQDWGNVGRRHVTDYPKPNTYTGRTDLYAEMTYKPISEVEQGLYAKALDDQGISSRRYMPAPGSQEPRQALQLLHWRPEMRPSTFVKRGGLAQENLGPLSMRLRSR